MDFDCGTRSCNERNYYIVYICNFVKLTEIFILVHSKYIISTLPLEKIEPLQLKNSSEKGLLYIFIWIRG